MAAPRAGPYDAIVLDILLPGMNGYQVCATLRDEGVWTPILMLTAKDGEYDEAEALDTGADDFLSKPFSFVVLLARLRALFRRGARRGPRCSRSATCVSTRRTRACQRGEHESRSPPRVRAARVPHAARRRRGRRSPRSSITCGACDFAGDPNVVEVYIGYLRRKIDQPFEVS